MVQAITTVEGIPAIPDVIVEDANLQVMLDTIKESIEVLTGTRGDPNSRALTYGEASEGGLTDLFVTNRVVEAAIDTQSSITLTGDISGSGTFLEDGTVTVANFINLPNVTLISSGGAAETYPGETTGPYGVVSGGGGGSTIVIQDEGIALTTDADTLNFVGVGVVASGTGANKTITINSTNATHTGQVTGSGALSLAVTAITDQPASGAVVGTDTMLINDGGVLSEVTINQLDTFFGSGTGFVDISGTPSANQIGIWTDADTQKGDAALTFSTVIDSLSINSTLAAPAVSIGGPATALPKLELRIAGVVAAHLQYDDPNDTLRLETENTATPIGIYPNNTLVGLFTDNGLEMTGNVDVTGQAWSNTHALTQAATIAWDCDLGNSAETTMTGNRTLGAPTNLKDGATYVLKIIQDGTGTRTLAYNAVWKFPGGTAPVLSTGSGEVDMLTAWSDGTNLYASLQNNFS